MGQVCRIGLDIAKEFFQVHGVDKNGKDLFNRKLRRKNVLPFFHALSGLKHAVERIIGRVR